MKKKFNVLAVVIFIILCICITTKSFQNDTFYTIRIGKLILDNGIDMLDHFSFHNIAYTYPHWLYDVVIYSIYHIGGYTGVYISTIVFFIVLICLIYYTCNMITKNQLVSFFMCVMCSFGLKAYVTARAQLVTYSFFVLEFLFIESFLKSGNKKYLIGLLLISILICNMHCAVWPFYFIMYFPFIAEHVYSLLKEKKIIKKNRLLKFFIKNLDKKIDTESNKNYKYLLYTMIISVVTGLLTPIGTTPYTYFIKTALGNSQSYIDEHAALSILNNPLVITVLLELIIILAFTKIKIKFRDLCMLCGLIIMALISGRHVSFLIVIGFICVCRLLSSVVDGIGKEEIDKIIYFLTKPIMGCVFVSVFILLGTIIFKDNLKQEYVDSKSYPIGVVNYIKDNIDISSMRLYNDYNYGSYILLNDIPVYIDSRADLYTKQFSGLDYDIFDDYMNLFSNFDYYMDFYGITHVVGMKDKQLGNMLLYGNDFEVLYQDEYFVFAKRIV